MGFEVKGLRELERNLKRMERSVRAIDGTNHVPVTEMFPPAFMRRHTDVGTFEELIEVGGFTVDSAEDFAAIPDAEWDAHIARVTRFPNWEAMLKKGGTEWVTRKIGF